MTTQSHLYKAGDLLQVPAFTEEQLLEADRQRQQRKDADPYREREAWRTMGLEQQRREQQGRWA